MSSIIEGFDYDKIFGGVLRLEKSDILTTLDRFCETMHFRLPKTTLN